MKSFIFLSFLLLTAGAVTAQTTSNHGNKFEQLEYVLPDPTPYRGVDGSPGPEYWQQRCDYVITCTLDVDDQRLHGEETITYFNQSPHKLRVAFGAPYPGKILPMDLATLGGTLICQRDAFLCAARGADAE